MTVSIRPASSADAPQLTRIYVDSWNAGFGPLMPRIELDAARVDRWAADLSTERTRWWVAEVDGSAAGFAGVGPSRDPGDPQLGELDTIAVDPARWRTGVGTALMHTALAAIVDGGFVQGILWTLAGYDRGQRFYESAGWVRDGATRDNGHQVSYRHDLRGVGSLP